MLFRATCRLWEEGANLVYPCASFHPQPDTSLPTNEPKGMQKVKPIGNLLAFWFGGESQKPDTDTKQAQLNIGQLERDFFLWEGQKPISIAT